MNNKFLKLYNLIMEDISTQRKPIQKVNAMGPKDFLAFLKEFLPLIKDGKVDLNQVRISEKVDGQALRLMTVNGEMKFESSYSGVMNWNQVPMKEAAKFLYDNYSQLFGDIHDEIGSDFKLIGELIWIGEMEESGKVTPVAASYLTNKFGTHGGMVVFDILKIENNETIPFEEERKDEIFNMIRDLNNEDFSFYLIDSIDITKNVTFNLDVDQISQLLQNPDFNKERFDKIKDAQLIQEIEKIKQNVCAQLSRTIENTKGAFSEQGDLIEGIVVKILGSGNQYGMFSTGYKDMKHKYWDTFDKVEPIYNEYFKAIFGYAPLSKKRLIFPKLQEDFYQFKEKFEKFQPEYSKKIDEAFDNLVNDENIPKAAKRVQVSMAKNKVDIVHLTDYDQFIKSIGFEKEAENEK